MSDSYLYTRWEVVYEKDKFCHLNFLSCHRELGVAYQNKIKNKDDLYFRKTPS
jgi:hypothetical protein